MLMVKRGGQADRGGEHRPGGRAAAELLRIKASQIERIADRRQGRGGAEQNPFHLILLDGVGGREEAVQQG